MSARALRRAVKRGLASRWGWRLAAPLVRAPGVLVLTYHRILGAERRLGGTSVERFAEQMRWVRERCEPIGPDALEERSREGRRGRPAVLVTFDDGYRDYHDLAYPILKALGVPAVVFLATALVDGGVPPWTDELRWAALHTRAERVRVPWSPEPARPALPQERAALAERACAYLKTLPDAERRAALARLLAELGEAPARSRQTLSWDEIRATTDLTTYGGHSHTHPILSRLTPEECEREVRTCRDRLAAELGRVPRYFAYPNGRREDFSPETQAILRRHGFTVAFATIPGIAGRDTDWMAVPRVSNVDAGSADLAWLAAMPRRR